MNERQKLEAVGWSWWWWRCGGKQVYEKVTPLTPHPIISVWEADSFTLLFLTFFITFLPTVMPAFYLNFENTHLKYYCGRKCPELLLVSCFLYSPFVFKLCHWLRGILWERRKGKCNDGSREWDQIELHGKEKLKEKTSRARACSGGCAVPLPSLLLARWARPWEIERARWKSRPSRNLKKLERHVNG